MERCLKLRTALLAGTCSYDVTVTADYGDKLQTFSLQCEADDTGTVTITVAKPQSISGITAIVDGDDGKLTFDDTVLYIPLLADGQVTPVCAPWLLLKTLRSGYIAAVGQDGNRLRLSIDDSYEDDALRLDIWLDEGDVPVYAEVTYKQRKILSLEVSNFTIQSKKGS